MSKAKMRIGSILLVVAMLMTLLPTAALADEFVPTEQELIDAEKYQAAFAQEQTWENLGNAALNYDYAKTYVDSLEDGDTKTAAQARLNTLTTYYEGITKLDMSGKKGGYGGDDGRHGCLSILTNLTELNLRDTGITNVGPLQYLTKLEKLDISNNPISDLGALAGLTKLTKLDASNTDLDSNDFGALVDKSLTWLDLSGTDITTIAQLTTHGGTPAIASSLVSLDVSGTAWSNFAELWKENDPSLSKLKNLTAQNLKNTITDIGALAEITQMEGFDASQYHWDLSGSNFASADDARAQQFTTVREAFAEHPENFAAPNMQGVANLTAAILEDHAKSNPIAKEDLADNYVVTSEQNNELVNVTITADNLRKHTNGDKQEGYWVGFALTAPEGAEKVKYGFGATSGVTASKTIVLEPNVTANGDSGIAF